MHARSAILVFWGFFRRGPQGHPRTFDQGLSALAPLRLGLRTVVNVSEHSCYVTGVRVLPATGAPPMLLGTSFPIVKTIRTLSDPGRDHL